MWIGTAPELARGYLARPVLTDRAKSALVPGATVALAGEGSHGKTQLAVGVARSLRLNLVLWVSATSRASVLSVYAEAAESESIPSASFLPWLRQTDRNWLVILDDLTDPAHLSGIWPSGPSGRVLVTTRSPARLTGTGQVIQVGKFSRHESMAYLMGRLVSDLNQRQGAADLVTELDDEPLALAQAAAVIDSSELSCRDYLEHYKREAALEPGASASAVSWGLSLEHVELLSPGTAQQLLAFAGMLDGAGIPLAIVPDDMKSTLPANVEAGLITADDELIRMATPVQTAIRAVLPDKMREEAVSTASSMMLAAWPQDEKPEWLVRALRSCTMILLNNTKDAPPEADVLMRAGQSLDAAGLAEPAVEWWRMLSDVLGPGNPAAVEVSERLTAAQLAAGKFTEALEALSGDVMVAKATYGATSPQTLAARETLAAAYMKMGGPADAVAVLKSVLADKEAALGAAHPETLTACCLLAEAQLADRRPKAAVKLLQRAAKGRKKVLGADHIDTIAAHGALGGAYHAAGRMASAVQEYERARDGYRRVLGWDDRETLAACLRLAHGYYGVGRLGDVSALLRDTLERCKRSLPASDPLIAAVRTSLDNVTGGPSE
jgi:tetratricopeptide (TPR) repeat protein